MINKECVASCQAAMKFGCKVGDPIDRSGVKTFGKFCLFYPCLQAREFAKYAYAHTKWSSGYFCFEDKSNEPLKLMVQIGKEEELKELAPFHTPRVKEAGVLPGYQMFVDDKSMIWGRSHIDGKIYSTGIDAWSKEDIEL